MTHLTSTSTTPGQKVIIQNAGVKRIVGTDLLTQGKIKEFMFYLVDIQSMVVFAGDGSDQWIGTFGQPAAASLTVRDSLTPFEGQRFYVLEQDISYIFKGGSWTGVVFEGNLLSPTFLRLTVAGGFTVGRKHLILTDAEFILPTTNVKDGHEIEFEVAQGNDSVTIISEGGVAYDFEGASPTAASSIESGIIYRGVFEDSKWLIFDTSVKDPLRAFNNLSDLDDAATARTNLDVFSKTESSADSDAAVDNISQDVGILITGSSAAGTKKIVADFANDAEAADPSNAVKVIAPKNIASAVSEATRSSEFNNITGLLPKSTETKFEMTQNADPTKVDFTEFSVVFNAEPFVRDTALVNQTISAGTITLPNSAVVTTHRVVLTQSTELVTLQGSLPPLGGVDVLVLGSIVELNGNVFNGIIISNPWLASTDYNTRVTPLNIVDGGVITASATVGKVDMNPIKLGRESINWEQSTVEPHQKTITPVTPITWIYLDQAGVILEAATDEVDGQFLDDDSTAVGVNNFSIQVAFIGSEGTIAVLKGQISYANLTAALAAVDNYVPVVPTVLTTTLEFSRWVIKGNQFPGGGSLDLTDINNFQVSQGADVSGGVTQVNAQDVSSSTTNNTLDSTNLQLQIDQLSARSDPFIQAFLRSI